MTKTAPALPSGLSSVKEAAVSLVVIQTEQCWYWGGWGGGREPASAAGGGGVLSERSSWGGGEVHGVGVLGRGTACMIDCLGSKGVQVPQQMACDPG